MGIKKTDGLGHDAAREHCCERYFREEKYAPSPGLLRKHENNSSEHKKIDDIVRAKRDQEIKPCIAVAPTKKPVKKNAVYIGHSLLIYECQKAHKTGPFYRLGKLALMFGANTRVLGIDDLSLA